MERDCRDSGGKVASGRIRKRRILGVVLALALTLGLAMDAMAVNNPPVAVVEPDQVILAGDTGSLNGLNSYDPDGDPLTYQWTQIAGVAVSLFSSGIPGLDLFDVPIVPPGGETLTFELTVSDGLLSDTATIDFTVRNTNNAPVADAGPDQTVAEGSTVTLDGSGSYDGDSDPLTYRWVKLSGPAVAITDADQAVAQFVAPPGSAGSEIVLRLIVSDGIQGHPDDVTVSVVAANQAPSADVGPNQTVRKRTVVTLDGSGSSDPDGDPLTYFWTQTGGTAVTLDTTNPAMPTFTSPNNAETLDFMLIVDDGALQSSPAATSVFVVDEHTDPPLCGEAYVQKPSLWPPKHQMEEAHLKGIFPRAKEMGLIEVTSITSDEPTSGVMPGDTSPDARVTYTSQVQDWGVETTTTIYLRAERDDNGDGRVYTIHFDATNQISGDTCSGTVQVVVPLVKKGAAIDSGQSYDALLY
jgi:hypothetical protein